MANDQDIQAQLSAMQAQMRALTEKLAQSEAARSAAEQQMATMTGPAMLAPGEAPVYELASPYFSPDDVFYPEGAQFEDITGRIIPNEAMIPMNEPARKRVAEWINSQPGKARTPPLELIMQAAMELRPKEGAAEMPVSDFMQAVMARAIERHYGPNATEDMRKAPTMPRRADPNVPLMSNTRINNQVGAGARTPATRLRQAPIAPANKAAPPTGGVSTNLGSGAPGVIASR